MVKLPWQKANSRADQIAAEFAQLVQDYLGLSEPAKNTVARRIPSYFVGNVGSRRKRLQNENNQALLATSYGASLNNYRRASKPLRFGGWRSTIRANSNKGSNTRSNTRSNNPRNFLFNNSRSTTSLGRYAPRSTNTRPAH